MSQTKEALLKVLAASVSAEDYLNAENIAAKEEAEFGTLTDLRSQRDSLLRDLEDLAKQIDKLDEDVQGILCSRRKSYTMPDHLRFPNSFDASAHSHLITERAPVDDEQQQAA